MPGTTNNRKIQYPLPTDPITSYPAVAQQFAQLMEGEIVVGNKLASDGPGTYPPGTSVLTLTSSSAAAGGWPDSAQACVLTVIRYSSATSDQGFQIWNRSGSPGQTPFARYRAGTVNQWGPWITLTYDAGWTTFASSVTGVSRYRQINSTGYIHVDGTVSTTSNVILNVSNAPLPASMWPTAAAMRAGAYFAGYPGVMSIDTAGNVTAIQTTGAAKTSLSCILAYPLG